MRNHELLKLIKEVAKREGLNIVDVERIVNSPFELQAYNMSNRCDREEIIFPSLRIPSFGIFYCPDWKKRQIQKFKDEDKLKVDE